MNQVREKQKAEAILRLQLMGVREDVRKQYENDGTVMLCDAGSYHTIDEMLKEEIRRFEQEHDATVFLVVRMFTMYGYLDALLFVGRYEEEWALEHADIKDGYAMSYTINRDYPECSEMGSIYFRITQDGGIVREG